MLGADNLVKLEESDVAATRRQNNYVQFLCAPPDYPLRNSSCPGGALHTGVGIGVCSRRSDPPISDKGI